MKLARIGVILAAAIQVSAQDHPGALPAINQIVDRHIQATGGLAAWARVSTQMRKGIALPGSANFPLESVALAPDKWTITLRMSNGRTMRHGFDGKEGWEERARVSKIDRDSILDETLIYDPFWVLRLHELFPTVSLKGIEKNGDSEVYVIEATPSEGKARILFFDVRDGLLKRAGKTMYADYRESGGVKVPFLVRYGYQTFRFDEIRHGVEADEAQFRMPAQKAPPAPRPETPPQNLPTVDQILNKSLAAVGGEEALARVRTQLRKGTLSEDAEAFPVETFAKVNGKWLLVLHTGGQSLDKEGYDGMAGWSESADVVKDMNPREQPELETFLDFTLPLKLSRMRSSMTVKAKEKLGGRDVFVVEAAAPQGGRRTLAFDAETGLLALADTVLFEDYREIGGLTMPFRIKLHGGALTVNFTEVTQDVSIEDDRFARPAPSARFEKNFAGLKDARAMSVLKRVIGQGVSPSDGRMLYDLIIQRGYKRALDIGTAEGYAALWFGLAMANNAGRVITIEIDPETADRARENIRTAGLDGVIDCRINDALLEVPTLKGDFDFVFMDPGAPLNKALFDLLRDRISPGGAILAHNAASLKSQQPDFLKALQSDPGLDIKTIPTARGGILMAVKKN